MNQRRFPRRPMVLLASAGVIAASLAFATPGHSAPALAANRAAAPIVLTGAQLPDWSQPAATGVAETYPSGATTTGNARRTAHNGRIVIPPTTKPGVDPDTIAAYAWTGAAWREVAVQVDQVMPYFLANGHSGFSVYSGTDQEYTYAWAPDRHATGEEAWKKVAGACDARLPRTLNEVNALIKAGTIQLGPQESASDYLKPMSDPVPGLDTDDEIALRARDAGAQAPAGHAPPTGASAGHEIAILDPLDQTRSYLYLFLQPRGSSFTWRNSDVQMTRDPNADEYIDRATFAPNDPRKLGTSNTGYGPNLSGAVCRTAVANDQKVTVRDHFSRPSKDRFPRDGMTVTTPTYRLKASGRWMIGDFAVTKPGTQHNYGPDVLARWKGRAFQQSPDSTISLVGFEDEQVNWEANGALLGWRQGPVRAMREIWGADSGTNVTKLETYYRDADSFRYRVRVHPIPPDGLYTSWAYNPGVATRYFNLVKSDGVPIDGINDDTGQISQLPGAGVPCPYRSNPARDLPCPGDPAYFDFPDPSFDVPSAIDRPEEVSGPGFGLVYVFKLDGATSLANAVEVPYYRDDACLDDGTGDAPVPRPWPGEMSSDKRVRDGYVAYWKAHGAPSTLKYSDLVCNPEADPKTTPPWKRMPFSGAIAQHGIHFLITHDSDNAFSPTTLDEIDGEQWRYSVPMKAPTNVLLPYGLNVVTPLQAQARPF